MSVDPRAVELMHSRIDGTITEEEKGELRALFERDPAIEQHFSELRRVVDELDGMPKVDSPPSLRPAVLASIGPPDPVRARESRPRGGAFLRYAYPLAAGLILGLLGYHVVVRAPLQRSTTDSSEFAGTMSVPPAATQPEVVDRIELELPAVQGAVRLQRDDARVLLEVELDSTETLDVFLAVDGRKLSFRDFVQRAGDVDSLVVARGSVGWSQRGPHRVEAVFAPRGEMPATIELELLVAGVDVYEANLVIPGSEPSPGP